MTKFSMNQQPQQMERRKLTCRSRASTLHSSLATTHSSHIPPRKPIIDQDYELTQDDYDAAAFVQLSYQDADLVAIGEYQLGAKQMCGNVSDRYISDEVLSFRIHFDITNI